MTLEKAATARNSGPDGVRQTSSQDMASSQIVERYHRPASGGGW